MTRHDDCAVDLAQVGDQMRDLEQGLVQVHDRRRVAGLIVAPTDRRRATLAMDPRQFLHDAKRQRQEAPTRFLVAESILHLHGTLTADDLAHTSRGNDE